MSTKPEIEDMKVVWRTAEDTTHNFTLGIGSIEDQIVVLSIDDKTSSLHSRTSTRYSFGQKTAKSTYWIERPDGTTISLPDKAQLFQHKDGIWEEQESDVTYSELIAFLDTNPKIISISELIQFVSEQRHP